MAQEIMARLIPRQAPDVPGSNWRQLTSLLKLWAMDYIILPDEHFGILAVTPQAWCACRF
jgi:hypothetical protein